MKNNPDKCHLFPSITKKVTMNVCGLNINSKTSGYYNR